MTRNAALTERIAAAALLAAVVMAPARARPAGGFDHAGLARQTL